MDQQPVIGEKEVSEMKGSHKKPISFKTPPFLKSLTGKRTLLIIACLIIIAIVGYQVRSIPGRFNEMHELDALYLYRMSQYVLDHGHLPQRDMLRFYPYGSDPSVEEFRVPIYLPVIMYSIFRPDIHFYRFAVLFPAIMGALSALLMFLVARELMDEKAGLFAAFFMAFIPAFLTRTVGGFYDKEPNFGFFMLISTWLFIASYKKNSWKLGILSGIFFGITTMTAGSGRYLYIFYFLFALALLLINRPKNLLFSYVPTAVVSAILQFAGPKDNTDSPLFLIFMGVSALIILRELVERMELVKKEELKYVMPAAIVVLGVGVLIAGIFIDIIHPMLNNLLNTVFALNPTPIGYTVAEQQPGNVGSMESSADLRFSQQYLPQLAALTPFLSIWLFMFLGAALLAYRIVRRQEWIMIFPLLWMISAMWGVFLFIRLLFLFAFPAALIAGLFLGWLVNKLMWLQKHPNPKVKSAVQYMPFYIAGLIGIIVVLNVANAFVYVQGLGPSACIADPRVLIEGERCLDVAKDGTITYAQGQPWYESMLFLKQLPFPKSVLSWWDFGHLFNARGETPSASDGGIGPRYETAIWYMANTDQWNDFIPYLSEYQITHIVQDYTLPGKYGAISAIGSDGKNIVGFLQFSPGQSFRQGNATIQELTAGDYAIWVPVLDDGNIAGPPILLTSRNGQYVQNGYINDVCTSRGIIHAGDQEPSLGGCVSFSSFGVYYVPESTKNNIFVSLQFMDGAGLPVTKVFDNNYIKIYSVNYGNNSPINNTIPVPYVD